MRRLTLTDATIRSLAAPVEHQVDYWDQTVKNLTLRVSRGGKKVFTVHYRFHRRKRRLTLGPYPAVSLKEARRRALDALAKAASGLDPAGDRIRALQERTFDQLCASYLEKHSKKLKSHKQNVWIIQRHLLPKWKHVKVGDISRADVRAVVEAIADHGTPVLANRVLAIASSIFSFAVSRDWRETNPCSGIERPGGVEKGRDRVLSDDEIRRLWLALEQEHPFHRALFQLRFLTAARGGEVRRMRWSDIDLARAIWVIPAEFSKNGEPHRVPLIAKARTILEELRAWQVQRLTEINEGRKRKRIEAKPMSDWVFPSDKDPGHFRWEQHVVRRLKKTTGINFRAHDIRRTISTALTEHCGADWLILKRIINHLWEERKSATWRYDKNTYDVQKRQVLERWWQRLEAIVRGDIGADVVAIRTTSLSKPNVSKQFEINP